jgi:predicted MPP superfamily phosphohydrolase
MAGQATLRPESLDVPLRNLPPGWRGARIVQISDIHAGRYIGDERVKLLADAAAAAQPDLVVITGDLVNDSAAFAQDAARTLAAIPAPLGVYACLGNHDYYAGAEAVAEALASAGIRLLRNEGLVVERHGDGIWLAGVDEAWFHRTDLPDALRGRPSGMTTVLLSHHPELFPDAAESDVSLQLSGHTHGGQIGFVRIHPSLSLYRLISPFVAGFYRLGDALLYVNRGAGAVQPLIRIGAPPEVTTLTLRDGLPEEASALEYRARELDDELPEVA